MICLVFFDINILIKILRECARRRGVERGARTH